MIGQLIEMLGDRNWNYSDTSVYSSFGRKGGGSGGVQCLAGWKDGIHGSSHFPQNARVRYAKFIEPVVM